jgi:HlyD family secretion protein
VKLDAPSKDERPKPIVFVRSGDSVIARQVTVGIRDDQYIEIVGGLKPGEQVISGSYKAISKDLEDGSKITVTNKEKSKKTTRAEKE